MSGEEGHTISPTETIEQYMENRWRDQLHWFESRAALNQRRFMMTRRLMLISSLLTPIAIFITILIPAHYRDLYSLIPLILSTAAVGSYQWEEQHNYGAQWAKFRLIAERLKHERELFTQRARHYARLDAEAARRLFVDLVEGQIEGTDVSYFTLMVDPEPRMRGER